MSPRGRKPQSEMPRWDGLYPAHWLARLLDMAAIKPSMRHTLRTIAASLWRGRSEVTLSAIERGSGCTRGEIEKSIRRLTEMGVLIPLTPEQPIVAIADEENLSIDGAVESPDSEGDPPNERLCFDINLNAFAQNFAIVRGQ